MVAGGQDRRGAEPLVGQVEQGVDVVPGGEGAETVDRGRVLAVTATGGSLARAKLQAYTAVKEIRWPGAWCRKDISDKGLRHERETPAADEAGTLAAETPP